MFFDFTQKATHSVQNSKLYRMFVFFSACALILAIQANNALPTISDEKQSSNTLAKRAIDKEAKPIFSYDRDYAHNFTEWKMIEDAMNLIQNHTCINFKEIDGLKMKQVHYVYFKTGKECVSNIGGGSNRNIIITLGPQCFQKIGVVLHEIGHGLGFIHEHQRQDRHEYVEIKKKSKSDKVNFGKIGDDKWIDYIPYDKSTIHHGAMVGFEKVLRAKDPKHESLMRQLDGLTLCDVAKINIWFKCDSKKYRTRCNSNKNDILTPYSIDTRDDLKKEKEAENITLKENWVDVLRLKKFKPIKDFIRGLLGLMSKPADD